MAKGFYFGSYKIADRVGTRIIPAILNIEEENNTTVRRNTEDFDTKGDVFVVFEPEQIHILGSKKDLEGFKEYVDQTEHQTQQISISDLKKMANKAILRAQLSTRTQAFVEHVTEKIQAAFPSFLVNFVVDEDVKGTVHEKKKGWIENGQINYNLVS